MSAPLAPALPVRYQLRVAPGGAWRARVFNLPPHEPGVPPALPFLVELAAWTPGPVREWHPDGGGARLAVLRLAGPDRAGLERLLARLRAHGISLAGEAPATTRNEG